MIRLWLPIVACTLGAGAVAQAPRFESFKTDTPPTIDGVLDTEKEWKGASKVERMFDNQTGEGAPENAEFYISYDKDFVYFAARLHDSRPSEISAQEYRTNVSLSGDDYVNFILDTDGALAELNQFSVNPKGATNLQLAGGRAAKREWSGDFVAKARITETGWEMEAKVPWQLMRLKSKASKRDLRFLFERRINRTQRTYHSTFLRNQNANVPYLTGVEVPGAAVDRSVLFLPYNYFGTSDKEGFIFNSGFDLKTNLAAEIPLVASVNPDFRNIENDILSLDFSRFERLGNETRPFFQEGASYMNSALFASQRIGSFDVGANVHGKLSDRMTFGVLNTVDFGHERNTAANFSYKATENDDWRFTFANRDSDTTKNDGHLIRYSKQMGNFNLFFRHMETKDSASGIGTENMAAVTYTQGPHVFGVSQQAISPKFTPRLGYTPERDYRGTFVQYDYAKPVKWGQIQEIGFGSGSLARDRYDGSPYRYMNYGYAQIVTKAGSELSFNHQVERFLGSNDFLNQLTLRLPRSNPYNNWVFDYQIGRFGGDSYKSVRVGKGIKPNKNLQIGLNYQSVDYQGHSDQGIMGISYDLGNDQSVSSRVVKSNKDWNVYFAFRKSGNTGSEYYLALGDPNTPSFSKSLILKVITPFKFK